MIATEKATREADSFATKASKHGEARGCEGATE